MQFEQVRQALLCGTSHWQCMSCPTLVHPLHFRGDLFVFHFANSQWVRANLCMCTHTHNTQTKPIDRIELRRWNCMRMPKSCPFCQPMWGLPAGAIYASYAHAKLSIYANLSAKPNPRSAVLFCITWIFFLIMLYVKTKTMSSLAVLNLIICNAWFDCYNKRRTV